MEADADALFEAEVEALVEVEADAELDAAALLSDPDADELEAGAVTVTLMHPASPVTSMIDRTAMANSFVACFISDPQSSIFAANGSWNHGLRLVFQKHYTTPSGFRIAGTGPWTDSFQL